MTTSQDLTPLLLDALGKRIDDPAAIRLAEALGKKPFKNATPGNRCDIGNRRLGIEVIAEMNLATRSHFPPRKDGRKWVTWVSAAFIYPNYRGSLPAGFDWKMDDAALGERFRRRVEGAVEEVRFTLPAPGEGLRAKVSMNSDGLPKHMLLGVDEEETYATIYPGSKPEHSVEEASSRAGARSTASCGKTGWPPASSMRCASGSCLRWPSCLPAWADCCGETTCAPSMRPSATPT